MTKTLFVLAGALLLALIALFVGGLSGSAPALMMLSLLCAGPLFFLCLGAALGRASNEFTLVRNRPAAGAPVNAVNSRIARVKESLG